MNLKLNKNKVMERNFNPFGGNKIPPTEQTRNSKCSNTKGKKEHLSQEQISILKSSIEEKLKIEKKDIQEIENYKKEITEAEKTGISGDRIDRANEQSSFAGVQTLSEIVKKKEKHILSLEKALVRIRNGEYGFDVVTGEPIPYARLLACPGTTKNVSTKEGAL